MNVVIDGKTYVPQRSAEEEECRQKLIVVAGKLNKLRAEIESFLWPSSGFAEESISVKDVKP